VTVLAPAALDPGAKSAVRIGLLASAQAMPDVRWEGGISYRPLNSNIPDEANSTFYPCNSGFEITTEDTNTVSWEPFGIVLGDECLSGSTDEDEETARARRRLEIQTEYLVSRTFWTGEVAGSTFAALSSPNRPLSDLASDELTTTGPVGVVTGFSRLIGYLADTIGSERGMIHVAPNLAPFLAFYGVAIRDGFQVLTAIADHIVVLGGGYDGSAPDGSAAGAGTSWIYATSMVRAAVSPISTFAALNRDNDDWETYASRLAIAEWDLQAHGAVQVCIPDPGPSCTEIPS
jgi:hypothetical protein